MKNYTKSTVRDLGSVADLTQAFVGGRTADGTVYQVPLPTGGTTTIVGTLSGGTSPFPLG